MINLNNFIKYFLLTEHKFKLKIEDITLSRSFLFFTKKKPNTADVEQ